jgi:hypothetical protein
MTQERRTCHYCDGHATRWEWDHAPIPASAGGTETVPSCIPCHNLKDRTLARDWFMAPFVMGCRELGERGLNDGDFSVWPSQWDDMSREARILWAKAAFRVHQEGVNRIAS